MFIIGIVIAAGLIYCFCYALPLTVKEIYQMIKSGLTDDFEE